MNEAERRAEAEAWLRYAREDLAIARRGLNDPEIAPRHSCYFSQQSAEKAIKGALIFLGTEFLFRHDLEYLNSLLPARWQFSEDHVDLEQLTQWVVIGRYPGDWTMPTEDDAREAVTQASQILQSIERNIEASDS